MLCFLLSTHYSLGAATTAPDYNALELAALKGDSHDEPGGDTG